MEKTGLSLPQPGNSAQCLICRHRCIIQEGKRGICQVRENRDGVIHSLVYGLLVAQGSDPVEKSRSTMCCLGRTPGQWPRWAAISAVCIARTPI